MSVFVVFIIFKYKRQLFFSVTRTCFMSYTNVFRSLHVSVTRVTRTCNGNYA